MSIIAIAACEIFNGIGFEGTLPWNIPDEMEWFTETTIETEDPRKHNAVVMGRKTWESLSRPLRGRKNIVISSKSQTVPTFACLEGALESLQSNEAVENIFIIGGAQIYKEAFYKNIPDVILINKILESYPCDTYMEKPNTNYYLKQVHYTKFTGIDHYRFERKNNV